MANQEVIPRAVTDFTEDWVDIGLDIGDYPLAGNVRDAVKMEVSERGEDLRAVCASKEELLAAFGEHLTRVHDLRWSARDHDSVLAEEQTRLLLGVHERIYQHVGRCEQVGTDWRADLHDLMLNRRGPAPTEATSDVFDIHVCTEIGCIKEGVRTVHANLDDVRGYLGNSLGYFLNENFGPSERALKSRYVKELLVIGMYIGPVAASEADKPKWAFNLKGRALQHVHEKFGDDRVATDDRYVWI